MIGVAQDDPRSDLLKCFLGHGLYGPRCSHRHESRRFHVTVGSVDEPPARCARMGFDGERESHRNMVLVPHHPERNVRISTGEQALLLNLYFFLISIFKNTYPQNAEKEEA